MKSLKLAVLVTRLAVGGAVQADARSHPERRAGVPAMVRRVLPAMVSIVTRQIEVDQFNQAMPSRGLGSGFIVDGRGYILTNNQVRDLQELHEQLSRHRVGEEVSLSVLRSGGQVLTVRPVLGREQ